MNRSAPGRDTSLDGPITETEVPMPFEIIVTKKTDMAWDGGKATEDLIPNAGDLVFELDWRRQLRSSISNTDRNQGSLRFENRTGRHRFLTGPG